MTSVLRLGVYRERIEKYGAGGAGCRRQASQQQQEITESAFNESTRTTFPVESHPNNIPDTQENTVTQISSHPDEISKGLIPTSSTSPDNHNRLQHNIHEQRGNGGKGKNMLKQVFKSNSFYVIYNNIMKL